MPHCQEHALEGRAAELSMWVAAFKKLPNLFRQSRSAFIAGTFVLIWASGSSSFCQPGAWSSWGSDKPQLQHCLQWTWYFLQTESKFSDILDVRDGQEKKTPNKIFLSPCQSFRLSSTHARKQTGCCQCSVSQCCQEACHSCFSSIKLFCIDIWVRINLNMAKPIEKQKGDEADDL